MMRAIALLSTAVCLFAAPAAADDELCSELDRFVGGEANEGQEQFIEMRWYGQWLVEDFGKTCTHSGTVEAKRLCAYLIENSSTEFPQALGFRILECGGYDFPRPWPWWNVWLGDLDIWRGERLLSIKFDFKDRQTRLGTACRETGA